MKKLIMMCVAALFTVGAMAQMQFKEGSLQSIKEAAAKADKPIFVDIYTTWCGPCKFLSSNIFPDKSVGEYMNANFINTKFDAEKGEGIDIAKQYSVKGYPTLLILNAEGKELGRLVGMSRTPQDFIQRVKDEMTKIQEAK